MKFLQTIAIIAITGSAFCAETEPIKKEGLTLRLVSDSNAIVPGKKITIGLFIEHDEKFHTYWKSPGIVGVATMLDWKLPKGFEASEILWPAPIRTKMATFNCYGYESDTCLLTEISVPDSVSGNSITFKVKAGWMCCATTCHPGWQDLEITLPVSKTGKTDRDQKWESVIQKNRDAIPAKSPAAWKFSAKELGEPTDKIRDIEATISLPESIKMPPDFDWSEVYFFCNDNQVNSNKPQELQADPDRPWKMTLKLVGTSFGPENPEFLSGVLFHPKGWPGLDTKWIEVSTRWPNENE